MSEYIFFGSVIAILTIISEITRRKLHNVLFLYLIILSIFLVGCRYYVGADWFGYKFFYEHGYSEATSSGNLEIGYMLWNDIVNLLGVKSGMYFAITSFLSLYIIYKAAKIFKIQNICFVFLVYYCLLLPSLQFNIVRTGLLGSCFILSLAYRSIDENRKSLLWILAGASMHYMGFILILILYFIKVKLSIKNIIISFLSVFFISKLGVAWLINKYFAFLFVLDNRLGDYVGKDGESYGISIGLLFNLIFFLCMYIYNKDLYNNDLKFRILLNTLFISICMSLMLSDLAIFVARIGQVLNITLIMLWPICISLLRQKRSSRIVVVCLFLLYYLPTYFLKGIGFYNISSETKMFPYEYRIEELY